MQINKFNHLYIKFTITHFQDYQFYYPFKYTIDADSIALFIKKNNLFYIAIFQYSVQMVSLYDIIATDNSFFQCDLYRLLFSFDKVWMYLLLKNILVEFETQSLHQNTLSSNFSMKLKELAESELRISILNQCFINLSKNFQNVMMKLQNYIINYIIFRNKQISKSKLEIQ
ncbi:unnamed protein product [Paramecium octaurelia]|uniref:Uncharacterized protein n=1 Tax=Paramecium octaurelia TaxID=43137 RepID=A0A8S1YM94_PAROT|nr:unnamed protein product [Paramecium octaurelia]